MKSEKVLILLYFFKILKTFNALTQYLITKKKQIVLENTVFVLENKKNIKRTIKTNFFC